MNKIEVKVLQEPQNIAALVSLACNLTQHPINSMDTVDTILGQYTNKPAESTIKFCQKADHQSVTRHGVYTVAVVGASRRFLAQIRTHRVGIDFTSASLQYQNVAQTARFVVPYNVLEHCHRLNSDYPLTRYNTLCEQANDAYNEMIDNEYSNDEAGYIACQALRNVLLITANAEAWRKVIEKRTCNRNTVETQYVTMKIWEALLQTKDGELMFGSAGPECLNSAIRHCRQGKMCCCKPLWGYDATTKAILEYGDQLNVPTVKYLQSFMQLKWPLLYGYETLSV